MNFHKKCKGKPTQRKYAELIIKAGFEVYSVPYLVGEDILIPRLQTNSGTMNRY